MATFTEFDDLTEATFVDADLTGARFLRTTLDRVVIRGGALIACELDDPYLVEPGNTLLINGVDVVPLIDAELNRRFPGRELRRAEDPAELLRAWDARGKAWQAAVDRVAASPGAEAASIDGEWSFAQTLRHLIMATDTWLRRAVLHVDSPYHPIGQPNIENESDDDEDSVFSRALPPYAEVLRVRAERATMVRDFIVAATPKLLTEPREHPWAPGEQVDVLHCLHTILHEEWEHLRYATRDLDALASQGRAETLPLS